MKLIISDYFRRWSFVLTAILIANFAFQLIAFRDGNPPTSNNQILASVHHSMTNIFTFNVIMWLGFLLLWDMHRGLPRVLISMPMTARQIGRALWMASVAFPTIALGISGLFAFLLFHHGANAMSLLEDYLTNWVLVALYLGAMFGVLTFMTTTVPDAFIGKLRFLFPNLLFIFAIMGFIFVQVDPLLETVSLSKISLSQSKMILIFAAYTILSVLGWFRAERMVLQRAGFRPAAQTSNKQMTQYKIPQGYGGLPYLVQMTFIQTTLIGLAIVGLIAVVNSLFPFSHGQNKTQMVTSIIDGGSVPFIFVLLISVAPMVWQLRFLRTLPIGSSTLAATLVFLPVASIAAIGLIVTALATFVAGEAVIPHTVNSFLMLGAKAAIMVSVVVWRGLDVATYFLIVLMVVSDSFITLALTLIFHLGIKTPEHPLWISLTIFLVALAVSFALTRRLLTKSSNAYRVRIMPGNAWSMARR